MHSAVVYDKTSRSVRPHAVGPSQITWGRIRQLGNQLGSRERQIGKTTLLKRKHIDPLPFLRWIKVTKSIVEHIAWRQEWARKDRLAFIRRFTKIGIRFFVKDGLEEWTEPFGKKRRSNQEGILRGWLTGSKSEALLTGFGPDSEVIRQDLEILQQAAEQEARLI